MKNQYTKNFKGHKWAETRKLTNEFLKKFEKDVAMNGHNAWKSLANPNGEYSSIKNRMILHNQEVRKAWDGGTFNKKERVLEAFVNYKSNTLKVLHVDNEHAVKESIFTNKSPDYSHLYNEDDEERIFGNSELHINSLNSFEWGYSYTDFCNIIDAIADSLV